MLKIDNHDITKYEYMVYLYTTTQSFVSAAGEDVWNLDFDGQTADELVEERTISTLQSVLAAEEYAAAHDIALTNDQKEEAAAAAKQFLSTVDADALTSRLNEHKLLDPIQVTKVILEDVSPELQCVVLARLTAIGSPIFLLPAKKPPP